MGPAIPAIGLALRSLLWTALLPGFFAGYLPWRFFGLARAPFSELRRCRLPACSSF
jgi:hypothetical protein